MGARSDFEETPVGLGIRVGDGGGVDGGVSGSVEGVGARESVEGGGVTPDVRESLEGYSFGGLS